MRVTDSQVARHFLTDLNSISSRVSTAQRQLSTGRQLNSPHDDPFGTTQSMSLDAQIRDLTAYKRNVGDALSQVDTAEAALGTVTSAVQRIRELMLQAANSTNDQNALDSIAAEIRQVKESIRDAANTRYAGLYVFSGTDTTTQPYPLPGNAYMGNQGVIDRRVAPGLELTINVDGIAVFGDTTGALPSQMNLLDLVDEIVTDLTSGAAVDREAMRTVDLDALDTHLNNILQQRANLGSLSKRLETTEERLTDMELRLKDARSKIVDVDFAQAMMEYQTSNTMYEAALAAGSRMMQTSLLDFI